MIDTWNYQTTGKYIPFCLEKHHSVLFYFVDRPD